MITLSKLELAGHCLHSFVVKLPPEKRKAKTQRGTDFHAVAAAWVARRFVSPPPELARMVETWWPRAEPLLPSHAEIEIAVAWDCREQRGRVLGHDIGRRYVQHGAQPWDVCGSIDVAWREPRVVRVVDHKTGQRYHAADASAQLLGASAILLATINIVGGFMVTQRMLRMFRR